MAKIGATIELNDRFTSVLSSVVSAVNLSVSAMDELSQTMNDGIDTAKFVDVKEAIGGAASEMALLQAEIKSSTDEQDKFNKAVNQGTNNTNKLVTALQGAAAAYLSISSIKNLITSGLDAVDTTISVEVQLATVMGNMGTGDSFNDVLSKAAEIQSKGIYGDDVMLAGASELATYFSDAEALMSMMDTLSNYAMGMSGGGEIDTATMVDYATGLGKIMTGSYDAMTKKGFEFSDAQKAIIEGTATEAEIVAELGAEYLSMSEDMQAAAVIADVIDESWAGLYETMSNTPEGQILSFNNSLGDITKTIGLGVYPAALNFVNMFQEKMPQVRSAAEGIAGALSTVINILTAAVNAALSFGAAVSNNWGWIEPVIWGIVAALIVYNATQGIAWLTTLKDVAAKAAHAAASAAQTVAILAMIVAQNGLNAALAACPITWIIMAVIALVAAFYAAVGAVNKFAGTSISATGLIMAAFAVLGAFIINSFIVPSWNALAIFVNFIGNAFNDPIAAVKVAFYGMCLTVIGYIRNLASAIETLLNKIPGVTVDITSGLDSFYSGLEQAQQAVKDESGWVEYMATMDYIDYADAAAAGYSFGSGVESSISDAIGGLFGSESLNIDDYLPETSLFANSALDSIGSDVSDIAGSASSIADSMDVTEENLAYLRDIAEQEAINRYTTAEINIDMSGMSNTVNNRTDLDGIASELADAVNEAIATMAEGVHV